MGRKRIVMVSVGLFITGILIGSFGAGALVERVTIVSLAPDETNRVRIVELPRFIDRNFVLQVENLKTGDLTTVYKSPDEGRPVGSERFVWASDSSRFVLLGRHFYVQPGARLPNGEALYLLYDLQSGKLWSNAAQQTRYPAFGYEDLTGADGRGSIDVMLPFAPPTVRYDQSR